jgi:PleD family two-component response regulator
LAQSPWFRAAAPYGAIKLNKRPLRNTPALLAMDWASGQGGATQKVIGYQGERRKILVIDDHPENRAVVIGMLSPLGFKVAEADDGQSGLELAIQLRPDLIITDVMMSQMNGLEMTRRLRQVPNFSNTPIIGVQIKKAGPS